MQFKTTEINLKSLGLVKISYISFGDLQLFCTFLNHQLSDKSFAYNVLNKLIVYPSITIDKLESFNEEVIFELLKEVIKNEKDVFKYYVDNGNLFSDFKEAIRRYSLEENNRLANLILPNIKVIPQSTQDAIRDAMKGFTSLNEVIGHISTAYKEQINNLQKIFASSFENTKPIIDAIKSSKSFFENLKKAGLTTNLGETRTIDDLKKYKQLLKAGYAIFWVPRAEINNLLLQCKTEQARKLLIISKKEMIMEDCKAVLKLINNRSYKNYSKHIQSAIDCVLSNNYRAGQSTANVCFDALLEKLIDTSTLTNFNRLYKNVEIANDKLKNINKIPINVMYASLQSLLISYSLRPFNRLVDDNHVPTKYTRHPSAHSVSAHQYNEFNAIQSIMIVTSLLMTTNKLGTGWLSVLADYV